MDDLENNLDLQEKMSKAIIEYFNNKGTPMSLLSIDSCCIQWKKVEGKLLTTFSISGEVLL